MTRPSKPGGELLRQDRGGDQRDRLDRRRHVADGVEAPVGGREIGGLADDGAAGLAHDAAEQREVGLRRVAGDRIELVERAAGVAEAAAGDHRHDRRRRRRASAPASARRCRRRRRSNACRGPGRAGSASRQSRRRAGARHGARQRHALVERHAAEEHRHGEGGGLALGDRAAGEAGDEVADLGRAQSARRRAWRG